MAAIATTARTPIATIPTGGRLLRAVPYSSPILKSICGSEDSGGGAGDEGVCGGVGLARPHSGGVSWLGGGLRGGGWGFLALGNGARGGGLGHSQLLSPSGAG